MKELLKASAAMGARSVANWRRAVRRRLFRTPAVYLPLRRLRRPGTVVGPQTELVIEGFPRCGNTWAEFAIREAQGRPMMMAHHSHAPAQVLGAAKLGCPTLVLYREPESAVSSMLGMGHHFSDAKGLLEEYVDFYSSIEPVQHQIVLASFEEVTQRLNVVISRLNARYQLALKPLPEGPEARARVFSRMDARGREIGDSADGRSRSNPQRGGPRDERITEIVREALATPTGEAALAMYRRLQALHP